MQENGDKKPEIITKVDIAKEENRRRVIASAQTDECRARALEYFSKRGLTPETCERFGLGFLRGRDQVLIPYPGSDSYFAMRITEGDGKQKYKYPAGHKVVAFNVPALTEAEVVAVVEGQIDAMTLVQEGLPAVGANAPKQLIEAIDAAGDKLKAKEFIIIQDNDRKDDQAPGESAGEKHAQAMRDALQTRGFTCVVTAPPAAFKDANEMLTSLNDMKAPARFQEIVAAWRDELTSRRDELKAEAAAKQDEYLGARRGDKLASKFYDYIKLGRRPLSTGFKRLDIVLGPGPKQLNTNRRPDWSTAKPGGLRPGLILIGGATGLGKTAFALNIAENLAEAGHDIVVAPLEMSANELIGRCVSRMTARLAKQRAAERGENPNAILWRDKAMTYQEIRDSFDWSGDAETRVVYAINEYTKKIGKRMHYMPRPPVGKRISAADIVAEAEGHKEATGRAPVVLVDYLQLLAPGENQEKLTEKQLTDAEIIDLKYLSERLETPILVVSSLNRAGYDEAASLASYKESGSIEYTADVAIGLQIAGSKLPRNKALREAAAERLEANKEAIPTPIEAVVLKNRFGARGVASFLFDGAFSLFEEDDGSDIGSLADLDECVENPDL